jgi:hypothetical protein
MRRLKTLGSALLVALVLVMGADYVSYAATGHGFVLGKSNSANRLTSLARTTNGPVLNLHARRATDAPLATNGRGRVANLNADKVDGLHAASLQTKSFVFTDNVSVAVATVTLNVPVPAGKYLISYSAYMNGSGSGNVDCYVGQSNGTSTTYVAESQFVAGADTPGCTGSGFVTKVSAGTVTLHIANANAFTTYGNEPIQIVMTRVDSASTGTVSRIAPGARSHR